MRAAPAAVCASALCHAAVGSAAQDLLAANQPVEFVTPEAALMNLLTGGVDAVLIPEPVAFSIARNAQVDAKISFLDPPVLAFSRFVALHRSRADLLPEINAALARMEADGRLPALRQKYFLDIPKPVPEVLTVGVRQNPPYQTVEPGGMFSGFGVEVLRGLAKRAGLALEFKRISLTEWRAGPGPGRYDLLPDMRITGERREMMDFSLPLEQVPYSVFTRAEDKGKITGLDDLAGRRVAALRGSPRLRLPRRMKMSRCWQKRLRMQCWRVFWTGTRTLLWHPPQRHWRGPASGRWQTRLPR